MNTRVGKTTHFKHGDNSYYLIQNKNCNSLILYSNELYEEIPHETIEIDKFDQIIKFLYEDELKL